MDEDLKARIRRLYAAVGETATESLTQFRPITGETENVRFMYADFRGGLSMSN